MLLYELPNPDSRPAALCLVSGDLAALYLRPFELWILEISCGLQGAHSTIPGKFRE